MADIELVLGLGEILRFECCDCGLTHDFGFNIKGKHKLEITIDVNNRSTGQHRRKRES